MGWQLCFMLETPGGMFLSAILLVLATLAFGSSLLGLYRCACCTMRFLKCYSSTSKAHPIVLQTPSVC